MSHTFIVSCMQRAAHGDGAESPTVVSVELFIGTRPSGATLDCSGLRSKRSSTVGGVTHHQHHQKRSAPSACEVTVDEV